MAKLNRKNLVEGVAEVNHISKKEASKIIDSMIDMVIDTLLDGEEVNITNFGVFAPKKRADRVGGHPKTHEKLAIKGSTTIVFRTSKALKEKLN